MQQLSILYPYPSQMEPLIAISVERLVEKLSKLSQEGKGVEIHK